MRKRVEQLLGCEPSNFRTFTKRTFSERTLRLEPATRFRYSADMEWWEFSEFRERGVPFAIDANGNWRDVDAVPRGKACGCFCPDCHGALIARQGDVLVHHFAHDDRRGCRHALEASLYGMAISLLTEPGALLLLPSADPLAELEDELAVTAEERTLHAVAPFAPTGLLRIDAPQARTTSLQSSTLDFPDLVFPRQQISIHLPVVDRPDEILRTVEKKCWCDTQLQEVRLGSGFYSGKRVLRCATNPKHPFIMLGP